jgi:hypothetical protein
MVRMPFGKHKGKPLDMEDRTMKLKVRRQWNDWRIIEVPVSELRDFHYLESSGGVGARSPRPMLYARMLCTSIPEGSDFPHSCQHGPPPHEILVCICKKDNPHLFEALACKEAHKE